jgi:hypothetical protein
MNGMRDASGTGCKCELCKTAMPLKRTVLLLGLGVLSANASLDPGLYSHASSGGKDMAAEIRLNDWGFNSQGRAINATEWNSSGPTANGFGVPIVPEPSTYVIGSLLLAPLGFSLLRRFRATTDQ